MDDRLHRRALTGFVKLILNLRLFAVVLTILWLSGRDGTNLRTITWLLLAATITSLVPILAWDRIGGVALRHPLLLLVDLVVSIAILASVSVESPFVLFVLATAMLAGALHGQWGAISVSAALLAAYGAGLVVQHTVASTTLDELLVIPVLIPLAALGGLAISRLLVEQATAARDLANEAVSGAAARERTRLAREMHDSLAKTLQGIHLTATTMPAAVRDRPEQAVALAERMADTARVAAAEARALLVELRADDLERPLGASIKALLEQWSAQTGTPVEIDVEDCAETSPSSRWEVFSIVREALRNVLDHADADQVAVELAQDGDCVVATIFDDGVGFVVPAARDDLADDGHFGIVGMGERARTVGGTLDVASRPGGGTRVTARIPLVAPGDRPVASRPPVVDDVPLQP